MQFADLETMRLLTSTVCKSVRGRPSCGERRTSVAQTQCRSRAQNSAPAGAVPNCRQRSCRIRTAAGGGRPSVGGRRARRAAFAGTRSGHATACTATQRVKLSLRFSAPGQSVALGCQTAEYGLPNPQFKRTCLRQAA